MTMVSTDCSPRAADRVPLLAAEECGPNSATALLAAQGLGTLGSEQCFIRPRCNSMCRKQWHTYIQYASLGCVAFLLAATPLLVKAETGYDAWLRYAPIEDSEAKQRYNSLPTVVVTLADSAIARSAADELVRGVHGMLDRSLRTETRLSDADAIVLGTLAQVRQRIPTIGGIPELAEDGFILKSTLR